MLAFFLILEDLKMTHVFLVWKLRDMEEIFRIASDIFLLAIRHQSLH